ncbi:MAG: FecR domain-containing protein [Verrucomicrobiae bacterium]|nr:FecR domain-containing protein [Verrucomicrobiae bacterium]
MKSELLDAYLCGDLRGESAAFIEAALKSDAALREVYFQQVRMDAALRVLLEDEELAEVPPSQFAAGIMARLASEEPVETEADRKLAKSVLMEILEERGSKPRPMGWWDWAAAAGVAAALVIGAVMLMQSVRVSNSGDEGILASQESSARFVARITAENADVTWSKPVPLNPVTADADATEESPAIVADDGWVRPGRLTLKSGVAEVTFNSGARVFLQGPAVFEVERPNRAFLESGRLTAEVPKPATGFVINTPRVNVVDLGTRFGLSVEKSGDTEVHVMQGVVEVSRLTGNAVPMVVEEGLAVRADSRTRSELQVIDYAGDEFELTVRKPLESTGPPRFLRYDFDESGGSEIEESGRGIEGGPFFASLFPDADQPVRPKRSVGRSGGGLVFTPGERFDSPLLAGFNGDDPLSVALWVRVPPRPERADANSMMSLISHPETTGTGTDPELVRWRMSWNADPSEGTAGALKVANNGNAAYVTGSTDLRDGRWHHVAFRFIGGPSADIGTHLQLYVDGQLEDVSGYRGGAVSGGPIHQLQLGGATGAPSFDGAIDEVHAFPEAVPPGVLQQLADGQTKL